MKTIVVTGVFLVCSLCCFSQREISLKYIDSLTSRYYKFGKWESLIDTAEMGIANGYNNSHIDIKLAIAYFKTGNYYKAIHYAKWARDYKDGFYDSANENLYWAYVFLGMENLAEEVYPKLNPEAQRRIKRPSHQIVDYFSIRGGVGRSAMYPKNLKLIGIGFGQKLSRFMKLQYDFAFSEFATDLGFGDQKSLSAQIDWYLGKGFSLHPSVSFLSLRINNVSKSYKKYRKKEVVEIDQITYKSNINFEEVIESNNLFSEQLLAYNLGVKYKNGRLALGASLYQLSSKQFQPQEYTYKLNWEGISVSDYGEYEIEGDTLINYSYPAFDNRYKQGGAGMSLSYNLPIWRNRLTLGVNVYIIKNYYSLFVPISPNISIMLHKKIWASLSYIKKEGYYLVEDNGKFITNYLTRVNFRITGSGTYLVNKILQIKCNFIMERRTPEVLDIEKDYYTFLLGFILNI